MKHSKKVSWIEKVEHKLDVEELEIDRITQDPPKQDNPGIDDVQIE